VAVPDFQSLMLPMLRLASDGEEHSLAESRRLLADNLGLTEDDVAALLPSGRQTILANRTAWAKVYLTRAGLLDSPRRGHFKITRRGTDVLRNPPDRIDIRFLDQFPGFSEFRDRRKESPGDEIPPVPSPLETPEEQLEDAYSKLKTDLAGEIVARVEAASPDFFERLVVELLLKMGYGGSRREAGKAIGRAGDEGIDGTISEDRLGLDMIYLQAKRWEGTVGRPEVQKFVGALHGKRAKKGVFLTTGSFSSDAREYVAHIDPKVVLIDGKQLAELMIDFEVGTTTVSTYHVKKVDSDYFGEE
jgi:restriction system protein